MTTKPQLPTFHTASPLRVGGRLAVLAALCAALVGGFVTTLSASADPSREVAGAPATCRGLPC